MRKTVTEAMFDPKESPFFWACARSDDIEARRRYLAFLTEHNDERAEILRCYLQLTATSVGQQGHEQLRGELRSRLRTLLEKEDGEWWRCVAYAPDIYSCGRADKRASPQVRFRFECPNNWETLEPTADADRRFCETCGEHVHWADSFVQAESLARRGACIAVPAALARTKEQELTGNVRGRPDWRRMWASQVFGDDRESDEP